MRTQQIQISLMAAGDVKLNLMLYMHHFALYVIPIFSPSFIADCVMSSTTPKVPLELGQGPVPLLYNSNNFHTYSSCTDISSAILKMIL